MPSLLFILNFPFLCSRYSFSTSFRKLSSHDFLQTFAFQQTASACFSNMMSCPFSSRGRGWWGGKFLSATTLTHAAHTFEKMHEHALKLLGLMLAMTSGSKGIDSCLYNLRFTVYKQVLVIDFFNQASVFWNIVVFICLITPLWCAHFPCLPAFSCPHSDSDFTHGGSSCLHRCKLAVVKV